MQQATAGIEPVLADINFGIDPLPGFHDVIAALRDAGHRVVPVRYIDDIAWLILRYDDVAAAYRDEEGLPAAPAYRRHSMPVQGKTLLSMDGEEHRINRLLVSRTFHPQAIERLGNTLLIPLANAIIDTLPAGQPFDLVELFAHRYPFRVIARMLGIPVADEGRLLKWLDGLFSYPWDPDGALKAAAEVDAYLAPIIHERRAEPADDLISSLATAEAEGQRLDDGEILAFIKLLYPAGADTTYLAIGSMMYEVLRAPGVARRLIDEPSLRSQTVEESLRMHGTVCLQPRYTEREVSVAGVTIPANSWILYGNGPANHDPAVFADPERFDVGRCPRKLMTFGAGPHFCLGSHLARAELLVSLSLLLDRLCGLRIVDADPVAITSAVLRGPRHMTVQFDELAPACEVRSG